MMMDVKEIMTYLPHRYPFLLVDRVLTLEKNVAITGLKNVTVNEGFFQGHFPDNPIMPGVLIIEAMAQVGGILAVASSEEQAPGVYFMSIERAKFRKPIVPGDQIIFQVKILRQRGKIWRLAGEALVEDKVAAEAEFTAMMTSEGI